MRVLFFALLLWAFPSLALEALTPTPLFQVTESEIYQGASPDVLSKMKYELEMEVYVLQESNWDSASTRHEVVRAAEVWEQCGLKFKTVNVLGINPNARYSSLRDMDDLKLVRSMPAFKKPSVFLIHEIAGEGSIGYSYRELRDYGKLEPLKGSIWLPDIILTPEYKAKRSPVYSTLAHELAHVLLNLGHTSTHNILGDSPELVNATLTVDECRRLRLGTYVKKI